MPEISVIIPTHNRRLLLERAVESVVNQTFPGAIELVICDDASTDDTSEFIDTIESEFRILYLRNDVNLGPSGTRNRAIRASAGRFVALLDDDDEWEPSKLEKCHRALAENDVLAVVTGVRRVFADGTSRDVAISDEQVRFPKLLAMPAFGTGSTLVAHNSLIRKVGPFDESLPFSHEDWDLLVRLASESSIAVVNEPLTTTHASGLKDLSRAEEGRSRFVAKHADLIGQLSARDRRLVLGNHDLHLFRLALAHRRFLRAARYATAASRMHPPLAISVLRSLDLARHGRERLSAAPLPPRSS